MGCCVTKYVNEEAVIQENSEEEKQLQEKIDEVLVQEFPKETYQKDEKIHQNSITLAKYDVKQVSIQIEQNSSTKNAETDVKLPSLGKLGQNIQFRRSLLVRKMFNGEQFKDYYEMGPQLGEGGFGQVFMAKHIQTELIRAVKIIQKTTIQDKDQILLQETNLLKNLDHPNIVKLFDIFEDSQCFYIVTEYCAGGEMLARIRTITNYSEKHTANYVKQILSALIYCHQRKIVHRDLKPENILFDCPYTDSNLKIIDFGASEKMIGDQSLTRKIGTPFYVAPEVLNSETGYDEKCDIWSLGVIIYILLSGRPPFFGPNEQETLRYVQKGDFTFPKKPWSRFSNEVKDLISNMILVDPKKRLSAAEAYNHPWIQSCSNSQQIDNEIIQQVSNFQAQNKLKVAVRQFISAQVMSEKDQRQMLQTFKALDQNGDGTLTKEEIYEGILKTNKSPFEAQQMVEQIFEEIDTNESGSIDLIEFTQSAVQFTENKYKDKIRQAFKMFDFVRIEFILNF